MHVVGSDHDKPKRCLGCLVHFEILKFCRFRAERIKLNTLNNKYGQSKATLRLPDIYKISVF